VTGFANAAMMGIPGAQPVMYQQPMGMMMQPQPMMQPMMQQPMMQ